MTEPTTAVTAMAKRMLSRWLIPSMFRALQAMNPLSTYSAPWAKLGRRLMPYTKAKPNA